MRILLFVHKNRTIPQRKIDLYASWVSLTGASSLMEQPRENHEHPGHIIEIPDTGDVATSGSSSETTSNHETTASTNTQAPVIRSSSASSTNNLRSPSHYKILVSIKLMYKLSLIIASTIVLANSRHEKPQNPLFNWILCYTIGCLASVPIIFRHCFLPHPW